MGAMMSAAREERREIKHIDPRRHRRRSPKEFGTALARIGVLVQSSGFSRAKVRGEGAMKFHIDWGKALQVMLPFHGGAHLSRDAMRPARIRAPRPVGKPLRPGSLSQNEWIADDSPMITAIYEAHLSMETMLAALAELRGDEAGRALG
jgi:hypothetical protein